MLAAHPRRNRLEMQQLLRIFYRYGVSMTGPAAVSAAHFVASLIVLRTLHPGAFGQFSFLLVIVPFGLSAVAALLSAPAAQTRGKVERVACAEIRTLQKVSFGISLICGLCVGALMYSIQATPKAAFWFGLYGFAFTQRGFARALANVRASYLRVAASDVLYAVVLTGGLVWLALAGTLDVEGGARVFAVAAFLCLVPFGRGYLREFAGALKNGALAHYAPIWRDVTRWSFLGVALTEVTVNAHAYLVTFFAGPKAFGLLAVGALFMRPASLVQSTLPEIDMPLMSKSLAQQDTDGAFRIVREFRIVGLLALAATMALAAGVMHWFPGFVLKKGYDANDVWIVLAFWTAITGLRALRTPEAVFLQAANRYPALARISVVSGIVSLVATLSLLFACGPVASLGGILLGEVAIVIAIFPLTRTYRAGHA
jgi:hypothetical protein